MGRRTCCRLLGGSSADRGREGGREERLLEDRVHIGRRQLSEAVEEDSRVEQNAALRMVEEVEAGAGLHDRH